MSLSSACADDADSRENASVSLVANLSPHDSLGEKGFMVFTVIILAALCVIEGLALSLGYWVFGLFFAFDRLFLLLAFVLLRRSHSIVERVVFGGGLVVVTRRCGGKVLRENRLRIFGLNVEREDDPDYGCQHIWLRLRQQRIEVAGDLSPAEREAFFRPADHSDPRSRRRTASAPPRKCGPVP